MKKVLAALAVVALMGCAAFAGEFNVKAGVDFAGSIEASGHSFDMDTGINITGEFLTNVMPILKIGGGLSFGLPRNLSDAPSGSDGVMPLPIYFTAEVNPISAVEELFIKGMLGYGFMIPEGDNDTESGLFYGIGAGWNFPMGLVVDLSYTWQNYSDDLDNDWTYSKLNLNVGWKFGGNK